MGDQEMESIGKDNLWQGSGKDSTPSFPQPLLPKPAAPSQATQVFAWDQRMAGTGTAMVQQD